MSTLIIHPRDSSTTFLSKIYKNIPDKTLITHGVTKKQVRELIKVHDRVIMLGHGTPWALMSVGQFLGADPYIIDHSMVELLRNKTDNLYIWCNADQFVLNNQLSGFFTGMFISEIEEAWYYNFDDVDEYLIHESNERFSSIVGRYINERLDVLFENVIHEYAVLGYSNPIARFNLERLNFNAVKTDSICHTLT